MNKKEIKGLILEIVKNIDYDLYKSYVPMYSEDILTADQQMYGLIEVVENYLTKIRAVQA